jgi:CBS domain-containing protein
LPDAWNAESDREILDRFGFEDISAIAESDLPEMAAMAAQDQGIRATADAALSIVFGTSMPDGVRQNLINDLGDERPWEQFADLDRQAGIFKTITFLQRAFPTAFGIPDAARVRLRATTHGAEVSAWLREGPSPALVLRWLAEAMDEGAILRRLYAEQLTSTSFPDAPAIAWSIVSTEDRLSPWRAREMLDSAASHHGAPSVLAPWPISTPPGGFVSKLVRDLMKTDVTTVSADMNMADLQRIFVKSKFGAVPVLDREHRLVGLVSRSDVVRKFSLEQSLAELADSDFDATLGVEDDDDALELIGSAVGRRLSKVVARDIMISEVETIAPDERASEAAARMIKRRIHRLPVLENGMLVGIISAFDFMAEYASEAP